MIHKILRKETHKYFFTGLLIMLPIVLTILAFMILANLVSESIRLMFPFLPNLPYKLEVFITIAVLILLNYLVGFLMVRFFDTRLERWVDAVFQKIPVIKGLYHGTKKVTEAMLGESDKKAFKRVVLIPFPNKGIYSLGFVTQERTSFDKNLAMVFVPQAPLPNNGYVMAVKRSEMKNLKISVNEAVKLILSGGILDEPDARILMNNPNNQKTLKKS